MLQVPATIENARKVRRLCVKHGLNMDKSLNDMLNSIPLATKLPGFNFTLNDFQAQGVAWLEAQGGLGILADEQGTGKTVQIMAYAHKNHRFPMLVVVPNTLKFNWRNEIIAMTGTTYRINIVGKVYSKKQAAIRAARQPNVVYSKVPTAGFDIYIINYDIVATNVENIEALGINFMAVDESHKVKNPNAKRTQAILRLGIGSYDVKVRGKFKTITVGSGIGDVTLMSGTPQVNKPLELWTSVSTVAPWVPEFSNFTKFAFRYCNPQNDGHGWNFSGSSNTAELNQLLTSHCMLRRIKADVLKYLPNKTWSTIPLDFDRREYDRVEAAFNGINWQAGMETLVKFGGNPAKSDEPIVAIQKLKEIAGHAKLKSAIEWIQDYTEEGRKLVVFAHHRNVITSIQSELEKNQDYAGKVQVIMGGIGNDERDSAVQTFQNDLTVRVIIVSIQAGGFGLTLTAASAVAFVQIPWSPAELQQCADRVHRVGQTANNVEIFVLTAEGTIEEDAAEMIMRKASVMDEVLDGGRTVNYVDLKIAGK